MSVWVARPSAEGLPSRTRHLIVGGSLGAVAGFLAGGFVGYQLHEDCDGIVCGMNEAVVAGVIGEIPGLALGVHAGNRGAGSLGTTLLVSLGTGVGGFVAGRMLSAAVDHSAPYFGFLALQLAATVEAQRRTTRR